MKEPYNFLISEIGLNKNDTIVIAVSGGPDSMALLHLMARIKSEIGMVLVCAHVNHNVRKESDKEKEFVENFCIENNIIFESMKIEDYGDDNFHNEARTKRYNYFSSVVKNYRAKYLLTAHHGDDLIETILMRLVRGSTLRGYSGFSRIVKRDNYTILRPLITVTKEEIYEYLNINHIPSVQDASNQKDVYTRNRFRKYIVPELKKEDDKVHRKFYKFSKTLLEYNDYIDKQVSKYIGNVYPQNILNIEEFLKLDHIIQMRIIYYILEQYYQDDLMLITDRHAELIYQLITSNNSNMEIYLPNNVRVVKSYNLVQLIEQFTKNKDYEIELFEYINLPNGKNIEVRENEERDGNDVCRLCYSDVKFPLHVRNRRDGDKMAVKGLLGHKKINDIYTDEKIRHEDRDLWPVVVDSDGQIIWLPGLKKSKFDKTKDEKYDIILKYY